jgi:hypothetical protein
MVATLLGKQGGRRVYKTTRGLVNRAKQTVYIEVINVPSGGYSVEALMRDGKLLLLTIRSETDLRELLSHRALANVNVKYGGRNTTAAQF